MTFYSDVFIVRLWHEPSNVAGAKSEWRGMVEHVGNGQMRYFIHPNQVRDFIASYSDAYYGSSYQRQRWTHWLSKKRQAILKHLGFSSK